MKNVCYNYACCNIAKSMLNVPLNTNQPTDRPAFAKVMTTNRSGRFLETQCIIPSRENGNGSDF